MYQQLVEIDRDFNYLLRAEARGLVTSEEARLQLDWLYIRLMRALECMVEDRERVPFERPEAVFPQVALALGI